MRNWVQKWLNEEVFEATSDGTAGAVIKCGSLRRLLVVLLGPPYAAPDECASDVEDHYDSGLTAETEDGSTPLAQIKTESEPSLRLLVLLSGGPLSFYFWILSRLSM